MSLVSTAGRRGRVWGCVVCPYRGERHSVMKHIFAKHLTIEEWPYQCELCQYSHYNYTNFSSHVKWYEIHRSMAATVTTFSLQGQEEMRTQSKAVFTMMRQWSIDESRKYWESKRRPAAVPPLPPLSSVQRVPPYPKITPRTSVSSVPVVPVPSVPVSSYQAPVSSVPVTPVSSYPAPVSSVPVSSSPAPVNSLVSKNTPPSLNAEEASILDEFLLLEDTSEFDVENVPPKATRDVGVNTSPMKDDVTELKAIIERQARALRNNTLATTRLEELLKRQETQQETRSSHNGPGQGERPDLSYKRKSSPPKLKSVVYQMPRRPARNPKPYGRPSPLDNLWILLPER